MNLLTNGGFEVNTTGWLKVNSSTISQDTGEYHDGVASCKVITNGVGAVEGIQSVLPQVPAIRAGEFYAFRGWIKAPDGATLTIRWYEVSTVSVRGILSLTGNGAWQYIEVVGTSDGSGDGTCRIQVYTAATQAITFYLDGLAFEDQPSPARSLLT